MSRSIQLMMLVQLCEYLQTAHYFNITTEYLSEFNFPSILNEKNALNLYVIIHQPNNSKSSSYYQNYGHAN